MIGVGLVGFATIVAASSKASTAAYLDRVFTADFVVESARSPRGSPRPAGRLERLPEVKRPLRPQVWPCRRRPRRPDGRGSPSYPIVDLGSPAADSRTWTPRHCLSARCHRQGWSVGDRSRSASQRPAAAAHRGGHYHNQGGGVGSYLCRPSVYSQLRPPVDPGCLSTGRWGERGHARAASNSCWLTTRPPPPGHRVQQAQAPRTPVINFVSPAPPAVVIACSHRQHPGPVVWSAPRARPAAAVGMTAASCAPPSVTRRHHRLCSHRARLLIAVFSAGPCHRVPRSRSLAMPAPQPPSSPRRHLAGRAGAVLPARRFPADVLAALPPVATYLEPRRLFATRREPLSRRVDPSPVPVPPHDVGPQETSCPTSTSTPPWALSGRRQLVATLGCGAARRHCRTVLQRLSLMSGERRSLVDEPGR